MKITLVEQIGEDVILGLPGSHYFKIIIPEVGYGPDNRYLSLFESFAEETSYYPDLPPLLRGIRNYQKLLYHWITQLQDLPLKTVRYLPLSVSFTEEQGGYESLKIGGLSIRTHDGDFLIVHTTYAEIFSTSPLYLSDYLEGRVTMTEWQFRQDPTKYVLVKSDFERDILLAIEDLERQYSELAASPKIPSFRAEASFVPFPETHHVEKDFHIELSPSLVIYFPPNWVFDGGDLAPFVLMCSDRKQTNFGQFMAAWFERWQEEIKAMRNHQSLFIPIEWGDQCFGGLRINQENDGTMTVAYGYINNPDGRDYTYFERDLLDYVVLTFTTTKDRVLSSLVLDMQYSLVLDVDLNLLLS